MNICHINLARGFRGGERQTFLLAQELAARGLVQRAIVRRDQPLARLLRETGKLEVCEISHPFPAHVGLARGFLLHAHEAKGAHFAHWANLLHGAPYLLTRRINRPPSDRWLTKRVYRKAAAVVGVAHAVAQGLREYEPLLSPHVIHSAMSQLAVNTETAQAIKRRWPGKFLVVHVGALDNSQKGQTYLIRAARRLATENPQIQFVLLGSGPDEARFRQEAAGLENVAFEGFVQNVGDYLSICDLFILPSLHEGIGGILLDAMSFSVPVVASAVDGLPEIVHHNDNGLLIPPADETALADAISMLYADAALRQRLGDNGKRMTAKHTPRVMADQYADLYKELNR